MNTSATITSELKKGQIYKETANWYYFKIVGIDFANGIMHIEKNGYKKEIYKHSIKYIQEKIEKGLISLKK